MEKVMKMKAGVDYVGVGVGALITINNKVLLLLRKKEPESKCWSIPGGKVNYGETIEDAVIREVKEELGVDSEIRSLLGVVNHILTESAIHFVSPQFLVQIYGTPQNVELESHEDMQWFNIDDLPSNISQSTKQAIELYKKQIKLRGGK